MLCGVLWGPYHIRWNANPFWVTFSRWVSSITISVVVTSGLFSQTGQILEITLVCEMVSKDKWLLRHVVACGFPLTSFGFVWDWDVFLFSTMVNRNHTTIWGINFIFPSTGHQGLVGKLRRGGRVWKEPQEKPRLEASSVQCFSGKMLVKQLKQLKSHLCADEFKSWLTNAIIHKFYIDALKQR